MRRCATAARRTLCRRGCRGSAGWGSTWCTWGISTTIPTRPMRLPEQKAYFEGARKLSDKNFLVMPQEEVNSFLDGHWYLMTPKPIYFTHAKRGGEGAPFVEQDPTYGTVY